MTGTELQAFNGMGIVSALAWGLGYFGMPHIIVRFMGIRSNSEIGKARRIGIVWMIISYIGAILIGTLGTVYLKKYGITLDSVSAETVFSATMQNMYPAFIAGIFLCAILAASMSTADSQLLAASSAVSQDIFLACFCSLLIRLYFFLFRFKSLCLLFVIFFCNLSCLS